MLREADIGAVQVRMASSLLAADTQSAGPGERFVGSGRARRANALGTGVACVALCVGWTQLEPVPSIAFALVSGNAACPGGGVSETFVTGI